VQRYVGYGDLEIYNIAYKLSIRVHRESLKLPDYELYEQGSQIRRSSKGVKDTIVEGYGRRKYKADYIKFLTYSIASCDETINHVVTINELYPDLNGFKDLEIEYDQLGRKINNYIQYVISSWRT
jgi:four helix bundle protein